MADIATTSRPYARAAFSAAEDAARAGGAGGAGALAQWEEFLGVAGAAVLDPQLAPLIGSPRVMPRELVQFLLELAGRPAGGAEQNLLSLLAENRRLRLLPEIAAQFAVLRAEAEGEADVELLTAMELTPEQLQTLTAALTQRLRRKVRIEQKLDRTLIGGAIVRHGDLVFDGSLRGRVERLGVALTRT